MRNIRLTDGSVWLVDRCGAAEGTMLLNVTGTDDLLGTVLVFGREELTARIEHYFDGTETDHVFFDGYKHLVSASISSTGVTLILKQSIP